jgi:uncharacterized protein YegJ (DUF2314 family)
MACSCTWCGGASQTRRKPIGFVTRTDSLMLKTTFLRASMVLAASVPLADTVAAQSISEKAAEDRLVYMADAEPAMRAAFDKAYATLDNFIAKARQASSGASTFAIKVGVRDGRDTEYMWLNELSFADDRLRGRINNQPRIVGTVEYGQTYDFSKEQVVDWMYRDEASGRMMGNFTACALLTKEPAARAEAFKRQYGLACD